MVGYRFRYLLLLALSSLFIYLPSVWAPFEFDDRIRISENPAIRDITNIPAFFYSRDLMPLKGDIYRPVGDASFALDYMIWGGNPAGFHFTNIIIHMINSILVFLFLELLSIPSQAALISALVFSLHPVQSEAVIWIKGRDDLNAVMFSLLTLLFYRLHSTGKGKGYRLLSLVAFILALLSKEISLTIPLLLLIIDIKCNETTIRKPIKYLPYIFIALLYLPARYIILKQIAQTGYWGGGPLETFYTMSRAVMYYVKLLIFPFNLCLDYLSYPLSKHITDPYVISSILFLSVSAGFGIYRLLRYRDLIGLSVIWFIVTLIPVSNAVPLKIILAERFLYLPSIGLALIYAEVFAVARHNWKKPILIIFVIAIFGTLTIEREYIWASSTRLWEDAVKKMPANDRAHFNLAAIYSEEKRFRDAIMENNIVLKLNPLDPMAYANRGLDYASIDEPEKAMSDYRISLTINPRISTVHHNMGLLYLQKGDTSKAVEEFEKELKVNPNEKSVLKLYEANIRTGNELFEKGDFANALTYYDKAVKTIRSREEAYINLSLTYGKLDNKAAAIAVYKDLLIYRPDLTAMVKEKINRLR